MFAKVSENAFDLSNAFQKRDQDRSRNVTIKILFRNCFWYMWIADCSLRTGDTTNTIFKFNNEISFEEVTFKQSVKL